MKISPGDLIVPLQVLGLLRPGPPGAAGANGKSAYELWLQLGNVGTLQDFMDSLRGQDAEQGRGGTPGKSAYEIWLDNGNTGTEQDFLDSLEGPPGPAGSAFQIDRFIITAQHRLDKALSLTKTPADPLKVIFVPYRGVEQESGVDFVVTGNTLSWNGLALELLLDTGDAVSIRYVSLSP